MSKKAGPGVRPCERRGRPRINHLLASANNRPAGRHDKVAVSLVKPWQPSQRPACSNYEMIRQRHLLRKRDDDISHHLGVSLLSVQTAAAIAQISVFTITIACSSF